MGYRFAEAVSTPGLSIIAEVKRRSPSAGVLRSDVDSVVMAVEYAAGGATCLSILTDTERFGGSPEDVQRVADRIDLPILRKDFLTQPQDVHDTATMGADALLLILSDLVPRHPLVALQDLALSLELDVLVEVRSETELIEAVRQGAYMIAVNQRANPKDAGFCVDYNKAERISRVFREIDLDVIKVAASGIGLPGGTSLDALASAGYDAALIGEALMTAERPRVTLQRLLTPQPPP